MRLLLDDIIELLWLYNDIIRLYNEISFHYKWWCYLYVIAFVEGKILYWEKKVIVEDDYTERCSGYNTKPHPSVKNQFWISNEYRVTPSFPFLLSPYCIRLVEFLRIPSTDQINLYEIMFHMILNYINTVTLTILLY